MSKIRNLKLIYISLCVLLALTCQLQLKEEDISGGKPSISDLNLLLPICKSSNINDCRDVVYRIKSQNGCFDWELEKNDALRLKKISSKVTEKKECFDSVLVITNTNRNPGNIYLISYDKLSEQRFKTKIGFGFIDKLSIYKRFANMDVGENLELGVTAKDVGNNSFSTVEGYVFNWKIIDNNKNLGELVKLSAENRQLSNYREDAEKIHFSDLVYLHGIKTGIVNIVAELKINGYNIAAPNKEVVIKEDFDLFPKEVFMPYEAQTIFNLFLVVENVKGEEFEKDNNTVLGGFIKKNKKVPVKEENYKNYKFTFNDQTCGNLTHNGKITFTSKTSKCITTLNIVDVRLPEHNNAEAVIHVVDPTSLDLGYLSLTDEDVKSLSNIEDFFGLDFLFNTNNRWILSNNKHYLIKNYLKYEDKQMFYDDKNNKLQFIPKLDSLTENKNIEILKTFYNGKYLLIKTIQPTKDYNKIQSTCLSNKSTKHVKIYDSIKIENFGNEKFYLPYLRNTNQELRLIINGGSGVYKIISSNEDVIYVKGNVLYAKNKGESFISVIDIEIENNKDSIPIEVKDIAFLGQLDEHLEVLVNSTAVLHIGAFHNFNSGLKTFTNCTAISLDHSFGEIDEINKSVIFKDENDSYLKRLYKLSKSTLMNYLDVNDKENDYINLKKNYLSEGYLNYSSFGFCSYKEIKSKFAKFISTNQGYEKSLNYQIPYINGLDPHIQFYENLVQTNPSTKDLIDLKVVKSTKEIYYPKEIILSPHSQLDLVFSKGVRPWNQHSNKKIEFTHDLKFNKIQSGIKKEIQKTDLLRNLSFNYMLSEDSILEIKCNAEFDFDVEVEFFTYNIKSSFLRNPANSKFTFLLSCLQPSHLSLIVEEDIERSEIFNVPQIDKIKYTKQINTSLFIRAYAFDKFFRLFTVFSQNDKLNKLKDFKELSFEPHNNIFYIRKKIEVNELTEFPVTYFSYNNLNHSILLNGINSAYLTPTSTTLYINREQNFIFNIIGGSGHFKLELTNDVGHLIYRPNINPRVVEFKPKIVGNVSLKLVDLKFSDKVISTANILVLDIHKIQIFSPSYLMVGC